MTKGKIGLAESYKPLEWYQYGHKMWISFEFLPKNKVYKVIASLV